MHLFIPLALLAATAAAMPLSATPTSIQSRQDEQNQDQDKSCCPIFPPPEFREANRCADGVLVDVVGEPDLFPTFESTASHNRTRHYVWLTKRDAR